MLNGWRAVPRNDNLPSQTLLRSLLTYSPEDGVFVWRAPASFGSPWGGKPAGSQRALSGYSFIGVKGYGQLGAHRLAWIYMHGEIPPGFEIDHIDGDGLNNRSSNLRLATSSQQKRNRGVQSNNQSGLKGVFWHKSRGRWRSQIVVGRGENGKPIYRFLGYFDAAEDAAAAYREAEVKHFGEFARAR